MDEKTDIDLFSAKLAYTIIQSLLTSNEALNDLLAVMAHVLDEEVAKALTYTNEWQNYIDSKRELETTKLQIEKFTEELKKMENERKFSTVKYKFSIIKKCLTL